VHSIYRFLNNSRMLSIRLIKLKKKKRKTKKINRTLMRESLWLKYFVKNARQQIRF